MIALKSWTLTTGKVTLLFEYTDKDGQMKTVAVFEDDFAERLRALRALTNSRPTEREIKQILCTLVRDAAAKTPLTDRIDFDSIVGADLEA